MLETSVGEIAELKKNLKAIDVIFETRCYRAADT